MYAVIKAGGKQHKVKTGDVIEVEHLGGGHDESISFTPILVVDDDGATHVGKDLGKATVKGKVLGEQKGKKVEIFKYKAKTGYSRRQGHRQTYSLVEIQDVSLGKRAAPKKAEESQPAAEPEAPSEPTTPAAETPPAAEKETPPAAEEETPAGEAEGSQTP